MDSKLIIIGVFQEGDEIILVDSRRQQYSCANPQDLWNDLLAIMNNKALPGAVITQEQVEGGDDLMKDACDQIKNLVGDAHGKLAGHLAGELSQRLVPLGMKVLRNISKRDRYAGLRKGSGT